MSNDKHIAGVATAPRWVRSYPKGVPAEVDVTGYESIDGMLRPGFERYREQVAFENMGVTLTYEELDRLSDAFAAWTQAAGLAPGDRIAIMMPNLLQYPVVLLGALRAGLVVVNTNPLYTARELRHQLQDSGARAIVVLENFAHVLEACLADTQVERVVVTRMGDLLGRAKGALVNTVVKYVKQLVPAHDITTALTLTQVLREGRARAFEPVARGRDDLAFLQYTGGTTGVAKGAELTHGNLIANVTQAMAWLDPFISKGSEVVVTALPLYHIFALTANCFTFFCLGGRNLLITNPRDLPAFVKALSRSKFTVITGVNTLFNALLGARGFAELDFSGLKMSLGGGMAVQRPVAERWQAMTGCTLLEAYGLTETSPAVCINPLDLTSFNGTIGLPVSSTECSVRDDDGRELPLGEPGELWVRGPQVMRGYWQRPEETALCLDADGWFRTGDVATMDEDGYVRIVDRKKDVINVSGFNVYPNEVEDVVAAHPGVREVGAIGVEDDHSGEAVRLVIVKQDPGLTIEVVQAHCREKLTGYKCPRSIVFADDLPKSNVGKILRRELRERHGTGTGTD